MEGFETKRLLHDKIEISAISANMNTCIDSEQRVKDKLGVNQLRSASGKRIERNINAMHDIRRKLNEVHVLMSELHEDNVFTSINPMYLSKFKLL